MKRYIKMIAILIVAYFIFCNISPIGIAEAKAADSSIIIDGYYDDWADKPYSWHFNWDNPWIINNKEYRDKNGNPYNLDIRHSIALYSDGTYVYVHVQICSTYYAAVIGDCYEFYIDGRKTRFQLTYANGNTITQSYRGNNPGISFVQVRHGDGAVSGKVVKDAEAVYTRKTNDINNEVEFKIPIAAMQEQNSSISDIKNFNTIQVFNPNLMKDKLACSGTSTGPFVGIALCTAFSGGVIMMKKKKSKVSRI